MRIYLYTTSISFSIALLVGCNRSSESTAESSPTESSAKVTAVDFANEKCPIMGGKPKSDLIAQYNGKTIGFCCEGCPEKWAALSEPERIEKFSLVNADVDQ